LSPSRAPAMPRSPAPPRQPFAFVPRVKVWLEAGGRYAFGLGVSEILQAVDRAGSIKQAAADLGKSYRHVWGRLKAAEEALGCPLVESQVGGRDRHRSDLTPLARQLVTDFVALRRRLFVIVQQEFHRCFG